MIRTCVPGFPEQVTSALSSVDRCLRSFYELWTERVWSMGSIGFRNVEVLFRATIGQQRLPQTQPFERRRWLRGNCLANA